MNMKENNKEPANELYENHRNGARKTSLVDIPINALRSTMRALAVSAALMGTGATVASLEGCTEVSHIIDAVVAVRELSFVNDYFKENKDALKKTSLKEILGHPDVVQNRFREAKIQVLKAQKSVRALLAVGVQLNPKDVAELEGPLNTMSNLEKFAGNGYVIGLMRYVKDGLPSFLESSADAVIAIQEFFLECQELKKLADRLKKHVKHAPITLNDEDRSTQATRFSNIRKLMPIILRKCDADETCRRLMLSVGPGFIEGGTLASCLREGDRGEYVRQLQSFLQYPFSGKEGAVISLYDGPIDAVYGEGTKEAVEKLAQKMDMDMPDPNCEEPTNL